jgi:DNA integrity scanning protein DisA with diadenylate cyclase activity/mannitol/fructose-specific phosphotransferase system IIA component (Ntr-type)
MSFHQHIVEPGIVELGSRDKNSAIKRLVQVAAKHLGLRKQKPLVDEAIKREEAASTFIGQGIAIPQCSAPIKEEYAIVVGRSLSGISYDAARGALAHIIVLVISPKEKSGSGEQFPILTEIASCFKSEEVRQQVLSTKGPVDVRSIISSFDEKPAWKSAKKYYRKIPDPVFNNAVNLARDIDAQAIIIFADALKDADMLAKLRIRIRLVVITSNRARFDSLQKKNIVCIQAPPFFSQGGEKLKIGLLLALSRNVITKEEKIVSVSGDTKSRTLDTIAAIDIAKEYEFFYTADNTILPRDIKPEVLERVMGIAGELAVEGREGKPAGTIFTIGDTNSVNAYVRQLIINPFRGYSEAERNILDPSLDETIKEFSSIDGAFIITGDGVVLSAGSYLRPDANVDSLPSGFGTRHAAAAGITACTKALSITISESTGTVTLFKNGRIVMSLSNHLAQRTGNIRMGA